MSLSLKLELHPDNTVSVTNSINQEKKIVSLNYIQEVTRNSLDILLQYKFYEICINAERIWNQVKYFSFQTEATKEIEIERKFTNIMSGSDKFKITDYDKYMYKKALPWINIYDTKKSIGKTITVIRQLEKFGWQILSNDCDYIIMSHYNKPKNLFIPNSSGMNKEVLKTLISQAGLTVDEFFSVI